jgi:uncharacterized protein (DUF1786 family)
MHDITVTRHGNGSIELSAMVYGHRVKQVYYFHTRRSALADFKQYLRGMA